MNDTGTVLNLTLRNDLTELSRVADEITAHGESHNWPEKWIYRLNLCLDELINNIIDYGYEDSDEHTIEVSLAPQDDSLVTTIKDNAIAFDPFQDAPEADLDSDVEDRAVGGLGVHFVTTLMDEYSYKRVDDHNYTTLVQYWPTEEE